MFQAAHLVQRLPTFLEAFRYYVLSQFENQGSVGPEKTGESYKLFFKKKTTNRKRDREDIDIISMKRYTLTLFFYPILLNKEHGK
jgi:hypothetical protein